MTQSKMYAVLVAFTFVSANCMSIGTVSDRNVTKRDTYISDIFPDFKNNGGENLGELVQGRRKKPAKRLALPVNFILRAVAEPQGEDYYSQGGGENEDNYENKDWSDLNRPPADDAKAKVAHTELSEIEGLVPNGNEGKEPKKKIYRSNVELIDDNKQEGETTTQSDDNTTQNEKKTTQVVSSSGEEDEDYVESKTEPPKTASEEAEEKLASEQAEREKEEAEAKKQKILSAVDDLKARHEKEQRIISEKLKEDEMYNEERERESTQSHENVDKYGNPVTKTTLNDYEDYPVLDSAEDKYKINLQTKSTTTTSTTTTRTTNRPKYKEKVLEQPVGKLSVFRNPQAYIMYDDSAENLYDQTPAPARTAQTQRPPVNRFSARYSTQTLPKSPAKERISLVPDDSQSGEGEPTLFFPKKRKNKRKKKVKPYASNQDSMGSETVTKPAMEQKIITTSNSNQNTPVYIPTPALVASSNDTALSEIESAPSASETGPSATDKTSSSSSSEESNSSEEKDSPTASGVSESVATQVTAADTGSAEVTAATAAETLQPSVETSLNAAESPPPVLELSAPLAEMSALDSSLSAAAAPSASDAETAHSHKKEEKKPENYEHEHGGHRSHKSEHHSSHGEHGKKAYKGYHENSKTEKGHHDKEGHSGEYHDAAGHDKHHHKASDHYGAQHHEEHGKKEAKYEESGKHSKGHSTKGSHDIHKKEEYEKKVEFFEEEGDSAEEEKHGGHHSEKKHASGGKFSKNKLDAGHHDADKGDAGKFEKGGHSHVLKGHKEAAGHDSHGKHGTGYLHKAGKESGKKWVYHHGYPAKTANLVVIDRRTDKFTHGPQYYG